MKKFIKVTLIVIGVLVLLVAGGGFFGWKYLESTFLDFEEDYAEKKDFKEITIDGYTFFDRNGNEALDVYEDERKPIEERVNDALTQMTIEEKIHLLKGSGIASAMGTVEGGIPGAVGTIVPTPRLGFPTLYLSDGPAGLRIQPTREGEESTFYCTAFPIATLLASTWNTDLVEQVGSAMGKEALEYGIDVILGPGANIHRHPLCGRNFEYYSEDPLLTGKMGASIVNGIESHGVGTSVKHFVANNQETNRNFNNAIVSDRAMREIYLKGFEIIVKESQPWTIMSAYNKVNGTYVPESKDLLTNVLRGDWDFQGLVMSDWFGGQDAAAMVSAGNDLLEPGTQRQWDALTTAYEEGRLSEATIDVSVKRILTLIFKSKKMQNYAYSENPDLATHAKITRQSASEGIVLLKNESILPVTEANNVALLGASSYDFIAGGTGSGDVNEAYTVSLEEGLKGAGFEINAYAKSIYDDFKAANPDAFVKPEGLAAMTNPYSPPQVQYTEAQIEQMAAEADIAFITIGRNAGEGGDRVETDDFLLTAIEEAMITRTCEAFHAAGKKVVVVLNIGGVIETASWKNQADAILLAWQGGQEGGNSVADILSGKVNPSGKLPMTFPVNLNDHAAHANFPEGGTSFDMFALLFPPEEKPKSEQIRNVDFTKYEEGIYVGYRHFDTNKIEVSYPFGYGMSYTSFEYDSMNVMLENDTIHIQVAVRNTGEQAGKEVIQVYVGMPNASIDRPAQELKTFAKTESLVPAASQSISLNIPVSELRYWNEEMNDWHLEKGKYSVRIGASSRDIKGEREIALVD